VAGSCSVDVVSTPAQAYEAAAQFGRFTKLLNRFDHGKLKTCIPDFHNLSLRYAHFLAAMKMLLQFIDNRSKFIENHLNAQV
jgi:hypothetical protein